MKAWSVRKRCSGRCLRGRRNSRPLVGLPLPSQQFLQAGDGKIGDAGEHIGEHAFGSTALTRQVVMTVSMMAARSAPRWKPAKVQFRRLWKCFHSADRFLAWRRVYPRSRARRGRWRRCAKTCCAKPRARFRSYGLLNGAAPREGAAGAVLTRVAAGCTGRKQPISNSTRVRIAVVTCREVLIIAMGYTFSGPTSFAAERCDGDDESGALLS